MMNDAAFVFATPDEIAKELAMRAKELRVNVVEMSQKEFAKKIGLSYGKYQRFEQNGEVRLADFILIATHLNRLNEITGLLKMPDIISLGLEKSRKPNKKRQRSGWKKE